MTCLHLNRVGKVQEKVINKAKSTSVAFTYSNDPTTPALVRPTKLPDTPLPESKSAFSSNGGFSTSTSSKSGYYNAGSNSRSGYSNAATTTQQPSSNTNTKSNTKIDTNSNRARESSAQSNSGISDIEDYTNYYKNWWQNQIKKKQQQRQNQYSGYFSNDERDPYAGYGESASAWRQG